MDTKVELKIHPNGVVEIQKLTRDEDGNIISCHRRGVDPGGDISGEPELVQRQVSDVWTPAVIEAFRAANTR